MAIGLEEVFETIAKQVFRASDAERKVVEKDQEIAQLKLRVEELEVHFKFTNDALKKYMEKEEKSK